MRGAQIRLQKQVYLLGEDVTGSVHFSLDEPVAYRSAMMSLIGKAKTRVSYQAGKHRATATEEHELLHQEAPITFPLDEKGKIRPGYHDIPFRFELPQGLPLAYEGEHGRIAYAVLVKVDIPLGSDINESTEFRVVSSDTQAPRNQPVNAVSDSWEDPQDLVGVTFTLERSEFQPGETLNGRCTFRNRTSKTIRNVNIRLECTETAIARGHTARTKILSEASQIQIGRRAPQGQTSFNIYIPEDAPPSIQSSLINVQYTLSVGLDIAWAFDVVAIETIEMVPRAEKLLPLGEYGIGAKRCKHCAATMPFNASYCSYCGASLRRGSREEKPPVMEDKGTPRTGVKVMMDQVDECMVCNLEVNEGDDVIWCPHCGNPAHRAHLIEWIRSRRACPMCGENLSELDFPSRTDH